MKDNFLDDTAVSPVVGEMLMIVLALLLVSLFSVTLLDLLPAERSPSVDILINNTAENVTLYHKGGDWLKKSDMQVIIFQGKSSTTISSSDLILEGDSFDLGDTIVVHKPPDTFEGGEIVRLVSGKSTVFSGYTRVP